MTTGSQPSSGWWPAEDEAATDWLPDHEPGGAEAAAEAEVGAGTSGTAGSTWAAGPPDPAAGRTGAGQAGEASRPVRLALGLAILAAERLRSTGRAAADRPRNSGPSAAFVTGVGLLQQTAAEAREVAKRAMDRPGRLASRTATWAARLPGANVPRRSLWRSRERLDRVVAEARDRGAAAVAESRADASAFVQATVSDAIAWAQAQAIPQIVDGLVPHLVDSVVPRIIDGAMPEIRSRVLPVVIDDLTTDPRVRELAVEQGRGVVGEAAEHLRNTSASADDRVETAFRRLVHGSGAQTSDVDDAQAAPPADTA
jgi:hypothetical protein